MYERIRKGRENLGYTREQFAEMLDVSVSYMAEVERDRTGISVKMLIKICKVLGLSADYILFGSEDNMNTSLLDKIQRIDSKYIPLIENTINELFKLSNSKPQQ